MSDVPATHYARTDDGVHIAYQVFGDGDVDLVLVPGFVSHLEEMWAWPEVADAFRRLGSACRVLTFDKRGTGMSDRSAEIPDLDRRMLDVEAVMDAAGFGAASLMGVSEGGPMCLVFAATHPERTRSLVLWGSYAMPYRTDDHPLGSPSEKLDEMGEYMAARWGTGVALGAFAPSLADDDRHREAWGRLQRMSASPGAAKDLMTSYLKIDARPALPLVDAPALVVHREGDKISPVELGRELAELLPNADLLVVPGEDHLWSSASEEEWRAVLSFLGASPAAAPVDRFLSTVLFTDIVSSTERAESLGDGGWSGRLDEHDRLVGEAIDEFGGRLVKHTGDGVLALFDGPTRAVRCAASAARETRRAGIEVRAGVHTGEIVDRDGDVAGIAVHLAQRVCGQAGPGEVLVTRTVVDLVAGSPLRFVDRGAHHLKGLESDWQLFALSS